MNILMQHSEILIRASIVLRQISNHLREGDIRAAMELKRQYKSELEPLMQRFDPVNHN